jgi:hypothetical protein
VQKNAKGEEIFRAQCLALCAGFLFSDFPCRRISEAEETAGKADAIISSDPDVLVLSKVKGIPILAPCRFSKYFMIRFLSYFVHNSFVGEELEQRQAGL